MPVALVTGTALVGGIAEGIVARLRADGWDVATSDRISGDFRATSPTRTSRAG